MDQNQDPNTLDAYDFDLPEEQIAQYPAEKRDASRLLALNREKQTWSDHHFFDLPAFLTEGDALVLNNTRVIPARLKGRRPTGGKAELLLVEKLDDGTWLALANPARKLREGALVNFGSGRQVRVEAELEDGKRCVRLLAAGNEVDTEREWLAAVGDVPLPPYIQREDGPSSEDHERYQTVFATERGAVAAPTAGLHFTSELLSRLREQGVSTYEVTLHVGYGTFEPVRTTDLRKHRVAPEQLSISADAASELNDVRAQGGRVVAVGTTTTRTLETSVNNQGVFSPFHGATNLTITPGHSFRGIDALVTNFHLPKSSLLVLVSAFAGRGFILEAYQHAVSSGYRFYSYGDSMLIL